MAFIPPHDRVLERSTSNSQSVFTVTGAADTSFNAFSASMAVGDTTFGFVVEPGVAFKSGQLTYSASNQITIDSSVFGGESKGTFSAGGTKEVGMGLIAGRFNAIDKPPVENLLINAGMEVSQINGTTAVTTINGYIVDQWLIRESGAQVITGQQVADAPPGFKYSIKATVTTANAAPGASDYTFFNTRVEGYRSARLGWGAAGATGVALGFWVKANRIGTYSGSIENSNADRSYPFSFSISVSGTWEYKTVVISGDTTGSWVTDSGIGFVLNITMMSGTTLAGTAGAWAAADKIGVTGTINGVAATSDYMNITGVSLVPGSVPVPGELSAGIVQPFDQELILCQRYWEKSYEYTTAPAAITANGADYNYIDGMTSAAHNLGKRVPFKVRKRASPTIISYSTSSGTAARIRDTINSSDVVASTSNVTEVGYTAVAVQSAPQSTAEFLWQWTADARM